MSCRIYTDSERESQFVLSDSIVVLTNKDVDLFASRRRINHLIWCDKEILYTELSSSSKWITVITNSSVAQMSITTTQKTKQLYPCIHHWSLSHAAGSHVSGGGLDVINCAELSVDVRQDMQEEAQKRAGYERRKRTRNSKQRARETGAINHLGPTRPPPVVLAEQWWSIEGGAGGWR